MVPQKLILSATVTIRPGRNGKPVSVVTLRLKDTIVAGGTLGGTFSPVQAAREFKRFHTDRKRFTPHTGYDTFVQANAAGLIL